MVLDIHSHILPNIDDGSQSVAMSVEMLKIMKNQGVDAVIATPHFYGDCNTTSSFLEKREFAREKMMNEYDELTMPEVFIGAEVRYFRGITKSDALSKFTLGKSSYILLEPPFAAFTQYMIDEIQSFASNGQYIPIIAHVERYLCFDSWKNIIALFDRGNIKGQINAGSLLKFSIKKRTLRLLSDGFCQYIAGDTHNLQDRAPCIDRGYEIAESKLSQSVLNKLAGEADILYKKLK
ncbi:MAG: CpsB/CapC family capsule biosynthesis tyrosine phosphatase [Clostridiales bacterium]